MSILRENACPKFSNHNFCFANKAKVWGNCPTSGSFWKLLELNFRKFLEVSRWKLPEVSNGNFWKLEISGSFWKFHWNFWKFRETSRSFRMFPEVSKHGNFVGNFVGNFQKFLETSRSFVEISLKFLETSRSFWKFRTSISKLLETSRSWKHTYFTVAISTLIFSK